MDYLTPWILTVIVEFIVIWIFIKNKPWKLLFYSVIVNSLTLPLATYTYFNILNNFLAIELMVIMIETVVLKYLLEIKYSKALLISICANGITAFIGYFLSLTFK